LKNSQASGTVAANGTRMPASDATMLAVILCRTTDKSNSIPTTNMNRTSPNCDTIDSSGSESAGKTVALNCGIWPMTVGPCARQGDTVTDVCLRIINKKFQSENFHNRSDQQV
jgi:hypothetical protein